MCRHGRPFPPTKRSIILHSVPARNAEMFQTLKSSPLLPSLKPRHRAPPPPPPCTPFEENLIAGLKSFPPLHSTPTLSWLAAAAALLSSTLSAAPVISDSDDLVAHIDPNCALLDVCNDISAAIKLLTRRKLLVRLALHLLPTDRRSARATLAEREAEAGLSIHRRYLITNLRTPSPSSKITGVQRQIIAIEAVAALFSGAAMVLLGGAGKADMKLLSVSEQLFPWAVAFNKVAATVYGKLPEHGGGAGEVVAVEKTVRELAAVIDGGQEGEEMSRAMEEAEKAVELLTEAVERLSTAINGVFRAAVSVRTMWLQSFMVARYK